jgi:hypothetical protein
MSNFPSNKKNGRKNIVVIELKDNILSKRVHPDLILADLLIYKPDEFPGIEAFLGQIWQDDGILPSIFNLPTSCG